MRRRRAADGSVPAPTGVTLPLPPPPARPTNDQRRRRGADGPPDDGNPPCEGDPRSLVLPLVLSGVTVVLTFAVGLALAFWWAGRPDPTADDARSVTRPTITPFTIPAVPIHPLDPQAPGLTDVRVGHGAFAVAASGDAAWVTNNGDATVSRIDASTDRVVSTIPVGLCPERLGVAAGSVWVLNTCEGTVTRLSATTDEVEATIPVGDGARALAAVDGAVWVASETSGSVVRIDPATNAVTATIPLPGAVRGIAATSNAVWVTDESAAGQVTRIDPATNAVVDVIDTNPFPSAIAATDDAIWVVDSQGTLVDHIDPETNRLVFAVRIPTSGQPWSGIRPALSASDEAVWSSYNGRLARIDPATDIVQDTFEIANRVNGIAQSGDTVWVTDPGNGSGRRDLVTRFTAERD